MENLGKRAKDKVTEFEGIIVSRCEYLFGCSQYGIAPNASDGKAPETCWFDEARVEILGEGIAPSAVRAEKPGGMGMRGPNNIIR